jgi:E3 ubiquitin-protein ligase MARCH6
MLDSVPSEAIVPPPKSFLTRLMAHPLWLSLSADIFTGQMIASLIVLTFVAVFLLREWISQNARPGVFEEEDALPDEPPPVQPPHNPPPPDPLQQHQAPVQQHQAIAQPQAQAPIPVPLPQHQLDTIQPVNAPHKQQAGPIDIHPDHWFSPQTPPIQDRRQKKKSRARHSDTDDDRNSSHRPRLLDSEDDASSQERDLIKRKMFHHRIHVARTTAARRRGFASLHKSSSSALVPPAVPEQKVKFNFTFKAPSAPLALDEPSNVAKLGVPSAPTDANNDTPLSPFPSVALQPPTADIPFSLRRWQQTTPNGSGSSISQSYPPRPPLPTATRSLPSSGSNSPFLFSPGRTPTESSSLATYRPPEELQAEAGPSNPSGYLHQTKEYFNDEVDQEFEVVGEGSEEEHKFGHLGPEHGRYFRDLDDSGSDEEEVEEIPELPWLQDLVDGDSEEDIGEGEDVNDQARRHEGAAAVADDDDEDDDGLFHEGEGDDEDEEPDAGEELFDQWDDNEVEAEVIGPQAAPIGAAGGVRVRAGNQVGEVAPAAAAVADNEEGNVEDDMDGAMEGWSYSCGLLRLLREMFFQLLG